MTTSFNDLKLDSNLIEALNREGIQEPTAIQALSVPVILAGKDLIGQSETGTGKTLAYLLPILQKLDSERREAQALILAPTHELALQIQRQIERLVQNAGLSISSAALIGNVNIARQFEKLKERPQLLVGSSGRILELIQKRKINAQSIKTIVLDEADRLLDEHNYKSVESVIKSTLKDRQLLFYSATISPATQERINKLAQKPEILRADNTVQVAPTIVHQYFVSEQRDKFDVLRKLVRIIEPKQALVFINKSEEIEIAVEKLRFHGLNAVGLHGSSQKSQRGKAMNDFRQGKFQLLVASDLAARGLDVRGISHVFNLDIPEDPQLYLHRVGRTGRAGQAGMALSIATDRELKQLAQIAQRLKIEIAPKDMYQGRIVDLRTRKSPANKEKSPGTGPAANAGKTVSSEKSRNSSRPMNSSKATNGPKTVNSGKFRGDLKPVGSGKFSSETNPTDSRKFAGSSKPAGTAKFTGSSRPANSATSAKPSSPAKDAPAWRNGGKANPAPTEYASSERQQKSRPAQGANRDNNRPNPISNRNPKLGSSSGPQRTQNQTRKSPLKNSGSRKP
jgi:superfamily II DNA/RNA helicase